MKMRGRSSRSALNLIINAARRARDQRRRRPTRHPRDRRHGRGPHLRHGRRHSAGKPACDLQPVLHDEGRLDGQGGSGLGLACADRSSSSITAGSRSRKLIGKGSRFTVKLPRQCRRQWRGQRSTAPTHGEGAATSTDNEVRAAFAGLDRSQTIAVWSIIRQQGRRCVRNPLKSPLTLARQAIAANDRRSLSLTSVCDPLTVSSSGNVWNASTKRHPGFACTSM